MELNKRTKIACGVLALALIALGIDRFSGGPAAADAAPGAPPAPAPKPATAPVSKEADSIRSSHGQLAMRIQELRPDGATASSGDAFLPPPSWFPERKEKAAPTPEKKPEDKAKHVLSAVVMLSGGSGSAAVIDGNTLAVGDSGGDKKGFPSQFQSKNSDGSVSIIKLVSASQEKGSSGTAVIEVDGVQITLSLDPKSKQEPKAPASPTGVK